MNHLAPNRTMEGGKETRLAAPIPPPRGGVEHNVKRMDPFAGEAPHFFLGVIREKVRGTAAIGRLYAALGDVGRKTFGLPNAARAVQITVVDSLGEPNESYTGIAEASRLDRGVEVGVMVGATFQACVTPSAAAWLITEIVPI